MACRLRGTPTWERSIQAVAAHVEEADVGGQYRQNT